MHILLSAYYNKALQKQRKVRTHTLNPKAIDRAHLLGSIDATTREWTDGVLTKVSRIIVQENGIEQQTFTFSTTTINNDC